MPTHTPVTSLFANDPDGARLRRALEKDDLVSWAWPRLREILELGAILDEDGCRLWFRSVVQGRPVASIMGNTRQVQRVVEALRSPLPMLDLPRTEKVTTTCNRILCVNPDHIELADPVRYREWAALVKPEVAALRRPQPTRPAAVPATRSADLPKDSREWLHARVYEMLSAGVPNNEVARAVGLSEGRISQLRKDFGFGRGQRRPGDATGPKGRELN